MKREELIKSPHYWLTKIQNELHAAMHEYMQINCKKKKDVAQMLGVSKGYVSQIFNGDFDHKLSKMIELSLAFGKVPNLQFIDIHDFLKKEANQEKYKSIPVMLSSNPNSYAQVVLSKNAMTTVSFFEIGSDLSKEIPKQALTEYNNN